MMKSTIKYIAVLLMLAVTLPAMAQKDKVVEASRKERPSWIGTFNQSSITVTEVGTELSKVSEKALSSIYQHIINSIAVNITSNEKLLSKSVSYDNIHSVMSDYTSVLMSEAAKIPFISNISLTNATDIYWEKIYSRKDNSYRYEYSVQYPFDDITRRNLVAEFVAIDNAKMNELKALKGELNTITDLDGIGRAVNALDALHSYFFDSTRRNETEALKLNYLALYSQIRIEIESEKCGECIFALRLGNRNVTTSVSARLRSTSALNMSVSPIEGNRYVLRYDPTYASTRDLNTIDIIYLFGARRVEKSIQFDAPNKK
jgi:hypothetical protein